jgi:hypothetical protein
MKTIKEIKERYINEYWTTICWDKEIEGEKGLYYHMGWRDALAWVLEKQIKLVWSYKGEENENQSFNRSIRKNPKKL